MAVCDVDRTAREATAKRFAIPRVYADAGRMLEAEKIDVLYSLVRAADRTDVEARAAARGIHLFCEKPQALSMKAARAVDAAVRRAGVVSTVGFRERYRPLFREARRLLAGRRIIHIQFLSEGSTATRDAERLRTGIGGSGEGRDSFARTGGSGLGWGVHAVDCARYISGLDVETAQAFYYQPAGYRLPLSYCYHFRLTGGATMTMTSGRRHRVGTPRQLVHGPVRGRPPCPARLRPHRTRRRHGLPRRAVRPVGGAGPGVHRGGADRGSVPRASATIMTACRRWRRCWPGGSRRAGAGSAWTWPRSARRSGVDGWSSSSRLPFVALDLNLILSRLRLRDVVGRLQPYPGLRREPKALASRIAMSPEIRARPLTRFESA